MCICTTCFDRPSQQRKFRENWLKKQKRKILREEKAKEAPLPHSVENGGASSSSSPKRVKKSKKSTPVKVKSEGATAVDESEKSQDATEKSKGDSPAKKPKVERPSSPQHIPANVVPSTIPM